MTQPIIRGTVTPAPAPAVGALPLLVLGPSLRSPTR